MRMKHPLSPLSLAAALLSCGPLSTARLTQTVLGGPIRTTKLGTESDVRRLEAAEAKRERRRKKREAISKAKAE